jgi:hypothetical protein
MQLTRSAALRGQLMLIDRRCFLTGSGLGMLSRRSAVRKQSGNLAYHNVQILAVVGTASGWPSAGFCLLSRPRRPFHQLDYGFEI